MSEHVSDVGDPTGPGGGEPADPAPAGGTLPAGDPVQLLAPDGTFRESERYPLELKDEDLRALYRMMRVTRTVDREAINLQRQGQLGVYASCLGQEAAQIGSAYALGDSDWVFPSYREMGAAVARGVDTAALLHLYRGTWLSDHDPYEHNFALMAIPIGTQALHGAGFAMGARFDDNPIVTMVYFGDGATSEGDTHEALNFAGVFEAPCVFFVQNNQYAISVPVAKQTRAETLAHKAPGYGMPGVRVDGNDVLATYAVTRQAVERARRGDGPTMIEAVTYRMEAHTTSDDPTRYRTEEELERMRRRDPIERMRRYLRARDLHDEALEERVSGEADAQAARMREEIYDAPHGDPGELFEHVYVDDAGHFDGQPERLAREVELGEAAGVDEGGR